jgi:type II secretory pathway pseudopilin PulG
MKNPFTIAAKRIRSSLRHRGRKASGQALIESLVGIIIFAIMLALIMTISMWLYVQQALVTSAREGARQASLNASMASTTASVKLTGINAVKAYVQDEMLKLTGQTLPSNNITITGPTGATAGQRTVEVTLQMSMKNPIGIAGMLNALGGNGNAFDSIPMGASATLRYEE